MRTTLTLDDDVLAAARVLARQQGRSVGCVLSALVRQGLQKPVYSVQSSRNGLPLLPIRPDGQPVDLQLVNRLRDELP
ncbi:ribbon-helix-helix domain-containing protein [Cyanobium sp. WAJ14-Wanaka]|uniref:ribbon-helix-helix domain-containing protein n=1 Tax=Cyanobium sp. WAJ14-Wanaka TaxID=2823725 RepID=UPI0020CC34BD|nr:ribbon-helix-helix domain-containing protein [Cyanobium sp. WAJ14-Wanaka]MCP9775774.1 CopG family transcriptional regulator [Cyanobium sp. WAJ14-Wanaka]